MSAGRTRDRRGGNARGLTCGYSCAALRNYFKLWRMEVERRDWEVRHVSCWPAAPVPAEGEIGKKS